MKSIFFLVGLLSLVFRSQASAPARNPFLTSAPSELMSSPVKRGEYFVNLSTLPQVKSGPVSVMTLASTNKNFMWSISSQGVAYVDVSNGGFKEVATASVPGIPALPEEKLKLGLDGKLENIEDAKKIVKTWGMDEDLIHNGMFALVDKENNVFYNTADKRVLVFKLKNPNRPTEGIIVTAEKDFNNVLRANQTITGMALTYDGKLLVLSTQTLFALNRALDGDVVSYKFHHDEKVTHNMVVDQAGGIYVASNKVMRKIVWTGSDLTVNEKAGGWISIFRDGASATPSLMGFGADDDKLVVATDGAARTKLVAFWRDHIPGDAKKVPDTKERRIAGIIPVTCGLKPLPEFIQSDQPVVVKGYGAFVVNNARKDQDKYPLLDVLAAGPLLELSHGVERFEWMPRQNEWKTIWARNDIISASMTPMLSDPSNIVVVNSFHKDHGWNVTGLDWSTGKIVHRIVLGKGNFSNGAYGNIQYLANSDFLFNSIGGAIRVPYASGTLKQAQEVQKKSLP